MQRAYLVGVWWIPICYVAYHDATSSIGDSPRRGDTWMRATDQADDPSTALDCFRPPSYPSSGNIDAAELFWMSAPAGYGDTSMGNRNTPSGSYFRLTASSDGKASPQNIQR